MLISADSTLQPQNTIDRGVEFYFPDEIAVEILSRLPATDVVRLRSVCKSWRDLTSSHNFMLIHQRRCLPMVLSQTDMYDDSRFFRGYDHYLLDRWWEPFQTAPKIYQFGKVSKFQLLFSNGGLVVVKNYRDYTIMNPIYHEKVRIIFSEEGLWSGNIYGVFFHPSLKEFCTLWGFHVFGNFTEYKILTLGSKPCWRDLNNPWSHMLRAIPPILMDEHLYWVVKTEADYRPTLHGDIMEFDIRKEEFHLISSPVPGAQECNEYNINLCDIGGLLSLVQTCPEDCVVLDRFEVNIWTLKDHARKLWTMSSYRINTDPLVAFRRPIALVNDELVLHDCTRRLFSCNLKLGTLRKLEAKRHNRFSLTTHVMSLASLRNCKSEIYVDKNGEVEE